MAFTGPIHTGNPMFPDTGNHFAKWAYRTVGTRYHEVLPYWIWHYKGVYTDNLTFVKQGLTNWGSPCEQAITGSSSVRTDTLTYAKAYDRFWDKVTKESGTASLGVTIAEWRSSLSMISNRSTQLITALNAIRKKDFGSLMESLNLSRTDKRGKRVWRDRNPATAAPGQLLEFHFGWVPMVEDVRAACKVLSSTPESVKIFGSSSRELESSDGSLLNELPNFVRYEHKIRRRVVLAGEIRIDNPNLDLANRMGLVNPMQLAWDLIPYSFLLNQFVGVSQYLERFTSSVGRTLVNGSQSEKIDWNSTRESRAFHYNWGYLQDSTTWKESGTAFVRQPVSSFSRPTILPQFKLPVSDLLGRAVTTTALLLQQLQGRNFREQQELRALAVRPRKGSLIPR